MQHYPKNKSLMMRVMLGLSFALVLTSCGGHDESDSDGKSVTASTGPNSTPPVPSVSPDIVEPESEGRGGADVDVPTTDLPVIPTPPSAPAAKLITLGRLTYSLSNVGGTVPEAKATQIKSAMDWAMNQINTIGVYSGTVQVTYNAGTPTAQASYGGRLQFGGSIGRRVALHELAHWLGSGGTSQWVARITSGRFTGPRSIARVQAYDGSTAAVGADQHHFWPYGLNYDSEFSEVQRNISMVSAQRFDLNIGSDEVSKISGSRRFMNRSSQLVLEGFSTANGRPAQQVNSTTSSQIWTVSYSNGYVVLTDSSTGYVMDSASSIGVDPSVFMVQASGMPTQQWEMLPTEDGWFRLRNRASRNCLDNRGRQSAGTSLETGACGTSANQQWHLIE